MNDRIQSYITALQTDPLSFVITMAYSAVVFLLSLILHEVAHGYVAYRCGDPTAKLLGRLSLDPRRHLHPIGTICMFLFGIGWAHPVPVNPNNFRNQRMGDLLVSLAGVTVNMLLFLGCTVLSLGVNRIMFGSETLTLLNGYYVDFDPSFFANPFYNVGYFVMEGDYASLAEAFPPFILSEGGVIRYGEGMEVLRHYLTAPWLLYVQRFLMMMAQVNLTLAIFNLFPIPPLDGFHVFNDILLGGRLRLNQTLFNITHFILIALMLTGVLNQVLSTCVVFIYEHVLELFLWIGGLFG